MKIKNLIFNLAIATTTLLFGLAWVGVYQFFIPTSTKTENKVEEITKIEAESDSSENANTSIEMRKERIWENDNEWADDGNSNSATDEMKDAMDKMKEAVKDAADKARDAAKESKYVEKQNALSDKEFFAKFDISGYYNFIDKTPVGFDDFHLEIWRNEYDEKTDKFVDDIPTGFILAAKKHYEFEKFSFSNGKLSFSTYERDGMKFQFSGKYERTPVKGYSGIPGVLKGKLSKVKNGKTLSTADVEFNWNVGC